jgi:Tfp pilus assembly protein PilV
MLRNTLPKLRDEQDGVILIEIVVSAMLLVIVALGVFTAFDAGTRATAQERHRARANSLAEQDVERMRGMRIADLSG